MKIKTWLVIIGGAVMLGVSFLVGHSTASNAWNTKYAREITYYETSNLHQMLDAMRDLRGDRRDRGLAKLDLLMLYKLGGVGPDGAAEEYRQQDIDRYFEEVYGMAALDEEKQVPEALMEAVSWARLPPSVQLQVGDLAPDFELVTFDGQPLRLAQSRGRVVLLTFFATWCLPCVSEMNALKGEAIVQNPDLEVIAIAIDPNETDAVLKNFVSELEYPFIFARDTEDRDVISQYAMNQGSNGPFFSIPVTFLIGRDGTIVARSDGFSEEDFANLIQQVEEEIAEGE